MCRRSPDAPVVTWLIVPLDAFAVMAGEPIGYRSSTKAFRRFCRCRGSPLTWRDADDPRLVDVSIASLDDPEALAPTLHLWTDSRIGWFDTADHLPRYRAGEHPKIML